MTKLAFRRLAAAIAGAAVLTGCTPAAQPVASADAEFQALVARELSFAEAGGASPEQLRILSESATEGELTYEAFLQAVESTFACFDDHKIRFHRFGPDASSAFPIVTYQYESPPDSPSAEASACIKANSQWVEKVYQVQPAAVEAADAPFEAAMPVLVACLREQGFLDTEDPTADEVRDAIWSVFEYVEEFPGSGVDPYTCPQKAGITDF